MQCNVEFVRREYACLEHGNEVELFAMMEMDHCFQKGSLGSAQKLLCRADEIHFAGTYRNWQSVFTSRRQMLMDLNI